ncbi:endonuclease VII domain-containing protein [Methylorubrum rhodesianum]|uniref:endonuclease VII domain-containing protein n=1 Tax=Methylorubrum rhodesianum TaxID=29427 RepID=UPI003CFD3BD1
MPLASPSAFTAAIAAHAMRMCSEGWPMVEPRVCRSCAQERPASEFRASRPDCRACERAACRDYHAANKPKRNARLSRWRRSNPEKAAAVDRRKRLRRYGLTEADRAQMETAQGGRCLLCGSDGPLVIDHCHATGRVRGLLCTPCNNFLGWVEGSPGIMSRARVYFDAPCHADVLLELANGPICEPLPASLESQNEGAADSASVKERA